MKLTFNDLLRKDFLNTRAERNLKYSLSTRLKTTVSFFYKTLLTLLRSSLLAVIIPTIIIALFNSVVFAAKVSPEVANISYWYGDEDIRAVLANRLGGNAYVSPAVPSGNLDFIGDIAVNAVDEVRSGKPALLPINLNNDHWTALAIRTKASGELIVFYNDSMGSR